MQASLHCCTFMSLALCCVKALRRETTTTTQSKLPCVPSDACGLSGVPQATLLLVALSRSFPLFFIFVPGDVDCCCAVGLGVSVYNAWSISYAFASILRKYSHTSFSGDQISSLLWGAKKKNHTEICKSKVLFQNKILVTFDKKVTFSL